MSLKEKLKYLDPYTYIDLFLLKVFGKPKKTEIKIIYWIFYLFYSLLLAFIIYNLLGFILGTSLPLATVVSGSMEPSFYRGDIIIINSPKNLKAETIKIDENIKTKNLSEFAEMEYSLNEFNNYEVKEITINNKTINIKEAVENKNSVVVYKSNLTGRDIIHRVIVIIDAKDGKFVLTKGDNGETNYIIDQDCTIRGEYIINGCIHVYPIEINDLLGKKIARIPYLGHLKLFFFNG
jgi:signal peptidase I